MAFTVYGLTTTASPAGPYNNATTDVTPITAINPAAGVNIYGFVEGQQLCKFFYSSAGAGPAGAVSLPTLLAPAQPPAGFAAVGGASTTIFLSTAVAGIPDPLGFGFTAATAGQMFFQVQFTAGSPDAGSPSAFFVDPYTLILVAGGTQEYA